jgi:hypothetical protein
MRIPINKITFHCLLITFDYFSIVRDCRCFPLCLLCLHYGIGYVETSYIFLYYI